MTNEEAISILYHLKKCLNDDMFFEAIELAIKALEQSDIIPVIIKDGDYKFDGLLDNNRQLLYGQGYTVEYVKDVLGLSCRDADNDN